MSDSDLHDRIAELEDERDNLRDQLDAANEELASVTRERDGLKEIGSTAIDYIRTAHELMEKGDF